MLCYNMAKTWMLLSSVIALFFAVMYFGWEDERTPACTTKSYMSTTVLLQDPLIMYIENFLTDDDVRKLKDIAYARSPYLFQVPHSIMF